MHHHPVGSVKDSEQSQQEANEPASISLLEENPIRSEIRFESESEVRLEEKTVQSLIPQAS